MKNISVVLAGLLGLFIAPFINADIERLMNVRDMYPSPSPDGSQLVFQSNRMGVGQIFWTRPDTSEVRQLTSFALGAESPAFSPDGTKIVFAAYTAEGNNDVFVMNADGSDLRQLTHSPGYDGHPHWSADGQRIAFNSDRTSADLSVGWSDRWHEIFSMKADGSDVQQHTRCRSVCTYGSLSPDGQKVLYRKVIDAPAFDWGLNAHTRNSEVFIADLDGENEINLTNNAAFDGWPMWSPDGKRIAIASNRGGPANTGQIWLMDMDGSNAQPVSFGPWSHTQPYWSSSGAAIYVYQHQETVDFEFGSVVRLSLD